jgi:hypothetical protein
VSLTPLRPYPPRPTTVDRGARNKWDHPFPYIRFKPFNIPIV